MPLPTTVGLGTTNLHACVLQEVLQMPTMTNCGPICSGTSCGGLPKSYGAPFVHEPSDKDRSLPVRLLDAWLQLLDMSFRKYRGKPSPVSCADPKQLVPKMTCAQQMGSLSVGVDARLRLNTCTLFRPHGNLPADAANSWLAVVWVHGSWSTFGHV